MTYVRPILYNMLYWRVKYLAIPFWSTYWRVNILALIHFLKRNTFFTLVTAKHFLLHIFQSLLYFIRVGLIGAFSLLFFFCSSGCREYPCHRLVGCLLYLRSRCGLTGGSHIQGKGKSRAKQARAGTALLKAELITDNST